MSQEKQLYSILKKVNVSNHQIRNGVRLTEKGMLKVSKMMRISLDEVSELLTSLSKEEWLVEADERFVYEKDFLDSMTVRDTKTGNEKFIKGHDAAELMSSIADNPEREQEFLAKVFMIQESDNFIPRRGGTFNFPHGKYFATAGYGMEDGEFQLEVISVRDYEGKEIPLSDFNMSELEKEAMRWVDKV